MWIHLKCFEEITDLRSDIEKVLQLISEGEKSEILENFLTRMNEFDKRFEIIRKKLNKMAFKTFDQKLLDY